MLSNCGIRSQGTSTELLTRKDHTQDCAFSYSGQWIVTGSSGPTINASDIDMANAGHSSNSGDGVFVSASSRTVTILDSEGRDESSTLSEASESLEVRASCPDGRLMISASRADAAGDYELQMWNAQTGAQAAAFGNHHSPIIACAFSPDGRRILSAGSRGRVWDTRSGREVATLAGHSNQGVDCAYSPDGRRIASAASGALMVWDAETGAEETRFVGGSGFTQWRLPGIGS